MCVEDLKCYVLFSPELLHLEFYFREIIMRVCKYLALTAL